MQARKQLVRNAALRSSRCLSSTNSLMTPMLMCNQLASYYLVWRVRRGISMHQRRIPTCVNYSSYCGMIMSLTFTTRTTTTGQKIFRTMQGAFETCALLRRSTPNPSRRRLRRSFSLFFSCLWCRAGPHQSARCHRDMVEPALSSSQIAVKG